MHDHMDFPYGYKNDYRSNVRNLVNAAKYNLFDIDYVAIALQKYNFFRRKIRKCWYLPNALSYERNVTESMDRDTCRKAMSIMPMEKVCLLPYFHI